MSDVGEHQFGEGTAPSELWDQRIARRALDELFGMARQYRSSEAYRALLDFIARFRFYSPFNAMLIHVQMPGAKYVAPAHRWLRDYARQIRANARPIVIFQPMGPVMFVFDVSDTIALPNAPPLPRDVTAPFEVVAGHVRAEVGRTVENARRDGVEVQERYAGSQSAGEIRVASPGQHLSFPSTPRAGREAVLVPSRYELLLNVNHSLEARYATLAHELGHLYCGHLGTPDDRWWPDRRGIAVKVAELEAESICYLICARLGISNPSDAYLASYLTPGEDLPPMSLDCVMKAAGLIEQMGRDILSPRKGRDRSKP